MKPSRETQVTPELVAYLDGELSERDHRRVAAAVGDSMPLREEATRFARVGAVVAGLERVAPSADFAATFRRRLEREGRLEPESRLDRWRRAWSAWQAGTGWRLDTRDWTPVLVPVASLLIILATLFSGTLSSMPSPQLTRSERILAQTEAMRARAALADDSSRLPPPSEPRPQSERIPTQVVENAAFFRDYWLTARLERWTHFEDIMRTRVPRRPNSLTQEQLPPPLIENPSFFMHYQILRRMEQFRHFESVQSLPFDRADQRQG